MYRDRIFIIKFAGEARRKLLKPFFFARLAQDLQFWSTLTWWHGPIFLSSTRYSISCQDQLRFQNEFLRWVALVVTQWITTADNYRDAVWSRIPVCYIIFQWCNIWSGCFCCRINFHNFSTRPHLQFWDEDEKHLTTHTWLLCSETKKIALRFVMMKLRTAASMYEVMF